MRALLRRSARRWAVLALLGALNCAAATRDCAPWPAWEKFRAHFVSDDGRVVDPSTPRRVTTSEGQSYGLFFAMVANDPQLFDSILRWTESNLAGGDLTARLPAWQWGERDDHSWGILDENAAADADLWIAYTLAEAGRLWRNPRYLALAELLGQRILREETVLLPGLGHALLPGPRGFQPQPGLWRLNPSYMPLQLLRRMAQLYPQSEWKRLPAPAVDIIVRSAPRGLAPEWILYKADAGFLPDAESKGSGSFNAIRVYLWAGMLADDDPVRTVLIKALAPMARLTAQQGTPPLEVDTRQAVASGSGPAGFSAALLPFLQAVQQRDALRAQQLRVDAKAPLEGSDNYYDQALTLFGQGWLDGRFRFNRDGVLTPRWACGVH